MRQTTDELLVSIKTRTLAPSAQSTFSDDNIINFMNEEMELSLVPMIASVREDFFIKYKVIPIVAGVNNIQIPERAVGNALKQTFFVDSSNNRRQLTKTDVNIRRVITPTNGTPEYFYFQGDQLILVPTPVASSGSIEAYYLSRPNKLVLTSSCAKITSISTVSGTTTFTVDTDLSSSISVGTKLDFLSGTSPFLLWAEDVLVTAITSPTGGPYTIAVTTTDIDDGSGAVMPIVNDYICLAQTANIPMVPQELHPILSQMVSARLMEALGHMDKLQAVNAKLKDMMQAAFKMICNRVEDQPKRILNRNGLLASSGFRLGQNSFR